MELSIRALTDQVKSLSTQRSVTPYHPSHRSSPAPIPVHMRQQSTTYSPMDKMANVSNWQQMASTTKQDVATSSLHSGLPHQQLQGSLPVPMNPQHQAPQQLQSHPFQNQQQVPPQAQYRRDTPTEDWEKVFLQALSSPDIRSLREILAHCPADKVMPLSGPLLVGQTIVLSVIHKVWFYMPLYFNAVTNHLSSWQDVLLTSKLWKSLSLFFGGSPAARKSSMRMYVTSLAAVNVFPNICLQDRIIHDYLDKMLPNIQENLFRAIPRFVSAGPQYNRQLSDLLQTLVIKAHHQ